MNLRRDQVSRGRLPRIAVAAGVTAFLAMAGAGVAFAVGGSGTPTASNARLAASSATNEGSGSSGVPKTGAPSGSSHRAGHFGAAFGGGSGAAGFGFGGMALGAASGLVHGQGVIKDGSTYKTYDFQTGSVTSVSSTTIEVKSADGFEASYTVESSTVVDSQSGGISAVAKNDQVEIVALVSGSKATATTIVDTSKISSSRQGFGLGGPTGAGFGRWAGHGPSSSSSPGPQA